MDHTDTGLRAVVKALTDVVAPAVSPADPLAQEQLRLAVDYLEFVRSRFEFFHDRERFDLSHHLDMAKALHPLIAPIAGLSAVALDASIQTGMLALKDPRASTRALKAETAALAAAIATVVQKAPELGETVRRDIEQTVLRSSHVRIEFERSWYLPLGFDPAPKEVRALAEFFAVTADR